MDKKKALIGLGSNLGDRCKNIMSSIDAISTLPMTEISRVSPMRETEPVGVPDAQPNYVNSVAEVITSLSPRALLGACLGIEAAMGRKRPSGAEKAARIIDLDLLVYEGETADDAELTLPHPRMNERKFVLDGIAELEIYEK